MTQLLDKPARALVVHLGGIGDFLLTCPAIERLAEEGPVELLGQPKRLDLAVAAGIAVAAHDMDRVDFQSIFSEPNGRLRDLLRGFDRCIVWIRDDGAIARNVRQCGVEDVRVFPGLPPKDWATHASRYYLDCLGMKDAPPLRLSIEPTTVSHDALIHPGSGGAHKNWPLERFISLANALEDQGRCVTWCLGPAEEGIPLPDGLDVLQTDSLVALARELAGTQLYVGNDSGITHLAAALGCPTLAIYGPTDPRVWAPRGPQVAVVQAAPWPEVEDVLHALDTQDLPNGPAP